MQTGKIWLFCLLLPLVAKSVYSADDDWDDLVPQMKFLTQVLQNCQGEQEQLDMDLHFINDANTTCNDGTPAG